MGHRTIVLIKTIMYMLYFLKEIAIIKLHTLKLYISSYVKDLYYSYLSLLLHCRAVSFCCVFHACGGFIIDHHDTACSGLPW